MDWEVVVGIETHAQLATRSKMFSGAPTAFGAPPNTQASAIDIALPGVLPVPNARAVEFAIRFGLAIGARINRRSVFARKNYFYPDLPKGYQISQYEQPIVEGGALAIATPAGEKTVRIARAHLEEDAGKSLHEDRRGMTGIDLNRAGTPLLEIVTEPDLRGAREAAAYARALHALVRWIEICDGNMQEGSFRCDANVSVRRAGEPGLGTRCEIKNLNSFRFLERAIEYEARRQIAILEEGGRILQETRLYDPARDETRPLRGKEEAHDYRYFPDPDLLPLVLAEDEIERVRREMPELPAARRARYAAEHGLSAYDVALLTESREKADYFERALAAARAPAKLVANWVNGEIAALLNDAGLDFDAVPIAPERLARLLERVHDGTVSHKGAKEVLAAMRARAEDADALIAALGVAQVSDRAALEGLVEQAIAANPKLVADFRAGRERALNALVGQVMKASRGAANPAQVAEILRAKLAG
ncbi:MAG: Asp-tRNA(Asn)/Glu-tRNA(Gln) amidotransferase subunit GatB [Burkholderiales bacterium]|nr:Asp-tRNA(Asn)/Glu-tRNA(Gln) amidotransferase subunit GatB [Burkholderiales bacterium]